MSEVLTRVGNYGMLGSIFVVTISDSCGMLCLTVFIMV